MTNEQHMSRPYITLDWDEVEAWVKSNPPIYMSSRGGYNIDCPVEGHKLKNQRLNVRDNGDGSVHLHCYAGCTEEDIGEAIAKEIKPPTAPDTEPPFVQARTAPQLEALEREWYSPEAELALDKLIDEQFADEQTAEYWETQATTAKAERDREHAARADAEERIQNLRGGKLQAHQEERDKAESQISGLRQDLKNAQAQHKRSQEKLRADNETLQKQLAAATPEVMNDAWRHIRNGEPLAAYREAMAILESKLRDVLGNPRKPTSSQELDLYPLMEMAATKGHINGKQLDHLDLMRERRNSFAHNSEEKVRKSKNPLTESEARATVAYLGQVIGQPEA